MTIQWIGVGQDEFRRMTERIERAPLDVLTLQVQMNQDIAGIQADLFPLQENGVADQATCSRAKLLNARAGERYKPPIIGMVRSYPVDELCRLTAATKVVEVFRDLPTPPPPKKRKGATGILLLGVLVVTMVVIVGVTK